MKTKLYSKERHCAATLKSPVSDVRLASEIFGIFDRRDHPFDRQKCCEIRGVRRNDYESKEPPDPTYDSCTRSLRITGTINILWNILFKIMPSLNRI